MTRVENERDSLSKKNLQVYSNNMNNRIECFFAIEQKN